MAVIRVTGNIGSGKTTLCKKLAEFLSYEYHSVGALIREMATEREQTVEEFYSWLATEPQMEKEIDMLLENLMFAKDNLVIDGRMAPFGACAFQKINILLKVGCEEGARRCQERPENQNKTIHELIRLNEEREEAEKNRYRKLYGIENHLDENRFDIAIDTTHLTKAEGQTELISAVFSFLSLAALN